MEFTEPDFVASGKAEFRKKVMPKKQIMALYAINKICTIANEEE
jgi:hypothetical protein